MRLPVAVPPGRHETVASYLARLASLTSLARLPGAACEPRGAHRAGLIPAHPTVPAAACEAVRWVEADVVESSLTPT